MNCAFRCTGGILVMFVHTRTTTAYLHTLSLPSLIYNHRMLWQGVRGVIDRYLMYKKSLYNTTKSAAWCI